MTIPLGPRRLHRLVRRGSPQPGHKQVDQIFEEQLVSAENFGLVVRVAQRGAKGEQPEQLGPQGGQSLALDRLGKVRQGGLQPTHDLDTGRGVRHLERALVGQARMAELGDEPQVSPAQRGSQVIGHRAGQGAHEDAQVVRRAVGLDVGHQPRSALLDRVDVEPDDRRRQSLLSTEVVVEGRRVASARCGVELPRRHTGHAPPGEQQRPLLKKGFAGAPLGHGPRYHLTSAAILVVLALVAGCGSDSGDGATSSSSTQTSSSSTQSTAAVPEVCAWATQSDTEIQNVAYPDTGATYWSISYALAPGEELEFGWTPPDARYSSFISYGPAGGAIDVLTDRDIVGVDETYTVRVTGDEPQTDAGDAPNVLAAKRGATAPEASGGAAAPTLPPGVDPPVPDVLLGSGDADDAVAGIVLYRVYLSADADNPAGGALPEVTVVGADGSRTGIPTCPDPAPSALALELAEANDARTDREPPPQPIFVRPQASDANLFPNPDNAYIATIAFHRPGVVAVVTGRAPTFGLDGHVRYWSLCTNEYSKPFPVSHCVADEDVVVADDGTYTFVISTAEDRPATATADNGVTWLEWGSTEHNNVLLMRHMLADPGFAESAINLEHGTLASQGMGPYAPEGRYCTVADFDATGDACTPT